MNEAKDQCGPVMVEAQETSCTVAQWETIVSVFDMSPRKMMVHMVTYDPEKLHHHYHRHL